MTEAAAEKRLRAALEEIALVIQAARCVVQEHDRMGSTSSSRRAPIIKLREALYRLDETDLSS